MLPLWISRDASTWLDLVFCYSDNFSLIMHSYNILHFRCIDYFIYTLYFLHPPMLVPHGIQWPTSWNLWRYRWCHWYSKESVLICLLSGRWEGGWLWGGQCSLGWRLDPRLFSQLVFPLLEFLEEDWDWDEVLHENLRLFWGGGKYQQLKVIDLWYS